MSWGVNWNVWWTGKGMALRKDHGSQEMTYLITISWQSSTHLIPKIQRHVVEIALHDVGVFGPQERAVDRHSIRARSSHKHIVWSPLWKRTQLLCQATYPNSCFKFPRSPSSAPCVPVFASYLPAPDPRNQLLETSSIIPRSLLTW